jgi:hypothetical protein
MERPRRVWQIFPAQAAERFQIDSFDDMPSRPASRWFHVAITRLGMLLLGVVLGLIVAEAGLRLLGLAHPGLYIFDRYSGWKLRPNAFVLQTQEGRAAVAVNSAGMRDREFSKKKPRNTIRIAVLGDSFTEAKQVPREKTFCAVIERELKACPALTGKNIQTLNFGCDSYGTAQELMTLRHRVWQFSPDLIVLAICTGNDIRNDSLELEGNKCQPFFSYRDGELVESGEFEQSAWFRFQCMLRFESQRSALLNILGQLRSDMRARWRRRHAPVYQFKAVASELGLDDWSYTPPRTQAQREAWRVAEGEIEMVHQEAAAHGARFLAVTLSNGAQVYPDAAARRANMLRWGADNLFYPDFRIKAAGERLGFDVLNLAPSFQEYADRHHVFLHGFSNTQPGAGHWNTAGHRYGGELIARHLCEMLQKPQPATPVGERRSGNSKP